MELALGDCNISVIIPCLNEADHIDKALQSVLAQPSGAQPEVLVVDGQSQDATVALARAHGVKVLSSKPSRSRQMNVGAEAASCELLLFLHADCILPERYFEAIQTTRSLKRQRSSWGAFETIRLDAPGWQSSFLQATVRLRSRFLHLPYGDQAIFVERDLFRRVGSYKQMPLLEDVDLVCRLRKHGPPALVQKCITTSARRWQRLGLLQTTLLNQGVLLGWRLGVDVQVLAKWYHRAGRRNQE
ncbi:hypothetical protein WJX84_009981 [Apatococcus fuscideae]|uniref:Glycosyltransferase 2-like domain-containing protein n=1 Tax=Apatococcus fuscideae TaxID=2026836 RepID=A0AAW1TDS4_9CHLO